MGRLTSEPASYQLCLCVDSHCHPLVFDLSPLARGDGLERSDEQGVTSDYLLIRT
jgi:hypothetical protein